MYFIEKYLISNINMCHTLNNSFMKIRVKKIAKLTYLMQIVDIIRP